MTTPPDPFAAPRPHPSLADRRTAVAALDVARPLVARMDPGTPPAALRADLADSWATVETALRALLGGTSLAGQALVTEARQRGLLEYPHAHALLAFHAARERADDPGHEPTSEDVTAARSAFQALEAALGVGIAANTGTFDAVRPDRTPLAGQSGQYGAGYGAPAFGGERGAREGRTPAVRADAAPPGSTDGAADPWAVRPRTRRAFPLGLVLGVVALLAALGGVAWWASTRGGEPRAFTEGVAAYRSGQREVARARFADAVREDPSHAASHVFLARLAREDGDLTRATSELTRAIELDTTSSLAYREMGQLQLQANRPDLASRFLVRAVERDGTDRAAFGWLGCAMVRQGQGELSERFFQRAGQGDWSACRPAAYGPPGAAPAPNALPGGYPPAAPPRP